MGSSWISQVMAPSLKPSSLMIGESILHLHPNNELNKIPKDIHTMMQQQPYHEWNSEVFGGKGWLDKWD